MNKKTNYNSIVFLTTLSVYLGLVLVGGAPQVFAQAALTRDFDIKNEIEFKDDLDNKPDNETCTELKAETDEQDNQFVKEYARAILSLLKKAYSPRLEGYDVKSKVNYQAEDVKIFEAFTALKKDLTYEGFDYGVNGEKFSDKLYLKSKSGNGDISSFASSYNSSLNFLLCESQDKPETVILKNTQITFENNQVFVITRLPRASIDELLARKVAQ